MKRKYIILLPAVLFVACSSPPNIRQPTTNSLYTVNLDTIPQVQVTMLSSIFKKVKTIILETTDQSVIEGISNMQVFEKYVFILDTHAPHELFTFDTAGQFVRMIGQIGHGPGDYLQPNDFTIDTEKKELYLLYAHRRINKYSIEGEFIDMIAMDGNYANYIQYHNGKLYVDSYDGYMLKEIDPQTGKEANRFLKTDEYNKGWNESLFLTNAAGFMSRLSKSPKFRHLFTDTFIALSDNRVEPYIALQSENLMTYSDIEKIKNSTTNLDERFRMLWDENKIFFFHSYFETKNYVYLAYAQGFYNGNGVLLDLQAKSAIKTILFNDLVFVQGTKILPIMQYAFSTLDGVYEWLNPQLIDDGDFFENIKNSYLSPDLDKLEELRKLTENSNPVIFYYSND